MKKIKLNYIYQFHIVLVILLLLISAINVNAQLKVGSNRKTLAPNVLLEVEATSGNTAVFSKDSAYLGIGTLAPTRRLDIQSPTAGAVKIVDGTQADGKVLTSDANGVATWKLPFTATPQNLTNSNGIIITGGTGATLTATSLRLDSTAVAKMMSQSPAKDSTIKVLITSNSFSDSINSIVSRINIKANNGISKSQDTLQLGGNLTKPTQIITSSINTLSLLGVQNSNSNTDSLLIVDQFGVVKKRSISSVVDRNLNVSTQTGSYNATVNDDILIFNGNTGGLTLTLPTTGVSIGKKIYVANISNHDWQISPVPLNSGIVLCQAQVGTLLMYVGTGWVTINAY